MKLYIVGSLLEGNNCRFLTYLYIYVHGPNLTSSYSNDSSLQSKWNDRVRHDVDDSVIGKVLGLWVRYNCSLMDRRLKRDGESEGGSERGRE